MVAIRAGAPGIAEIVGAREIEAILRKLPDRVAKRVLNNAVMAGANVIVREAKARAPVRSGGGAKRRTATTATLPGFLRASIRRKKLKKPGHVLVGPDARAFYGVFVERGTRRARARPFLGPAFDAGAPGALRKIGEILGRGLAREAAKLGRENPTRRR